MMLRYISKNYKNDIVLGFTKENKYFKYKKYAIDFKFGIQLIMLLFIHEYICSIRDLDYSVLFRRLNFWLSVDYFYLAGARGIMVIVVGNGHGDTSSNPGRD